MSHVPMSCSGRREDADAAKVLMAGLPVQFLFLLLTRGKVLAYLCSVSWDLNVLLSLNGLLLSSPAVGC